VYDQNLVSVSATETKIKFRCRNFLCLYRNFPPFFLPWFFFSPEMLWLNFCFKNCHAGTELLVCFMAIARFIFQKCPYRISANSFLPPLNSFRGNYSIYEVKNCRNAENIWKFPHSLLPKKHSFRGNYSWKYGIFNLWVFISPSIYALEK
jgi:hypothetical protein